MKSFVYEGPARFRYFYTNSSFTGEMIEITEKEFDSVVVMYRDSFKRQYVDGGQRFVCGDIVYERYYEKRY